MKVWSVIGDCPPAVRSRDFVRIATSNKMDFFNFQIPFLQSVYGEYSKPEVIPLIILIGAAILTLLITIYFTRLLNNDDERPLSFTIPLPEQCKSGWKGEVLDDPKIKA